MNTREFAIASSIETVPKSFKADYVSSAASLADLPEALPVSVTEAPASGDVVLARVIKVNEAYPTLELENGTEVVLEANQFIVGVLGSRRALHGFSGRVPSQLETGQPLHLLNKGGVIGECTAFHRDLEWPTLLEYVGSVALDQEPLSIRDHGLPLWDGPLPDVPVVAILGTCMNAGKTTAGKKIIESFTRRGFKVTAGKVAGVACRQDLLTMKRAGAEKVLSFHDFGVPSSSDTTPLIPVARSLIHHLAEPKPDFIVLEMGDGILGGYHVSTLFDDQELMGLVCGTVLCANDLMGTWGALQWLQSCPSPTPADSILVSGRVTDSGEGIRYIETNWNIWAANPFDCPGKLSDFVQRKLQPW